MENPLSSERVATVWSDNASPQVCNGVGVDGKWEHQ